MVQRPIQDEQIGDFYVRNNGGDSIVDSELISVVLTLNKTNSNSSSSILEIINQGTGFDIFGSNFSISKNGQILSQSILTSLLTVDDLVVSNSFSLPANFNIIDLSVLNSLHVSGSQTITQNLTIDNDLLVAGDFNLSGNQIIDGTLEVQEDMTINGNLIVTDTFTLGSVAFLNSNVNISGETNFFNKLTIDTPNTDQLLIKSNNSTNVNLRLENNSVTGTTGFTTLTLKSNANPLAYPAISFQRGAINYLQRIGPVLTEFNFAVTNPAGFTSRFINESVGDHNVAIQGNLTVNKNITSLGNMSVAGSTSFGTLGATTGIITEILTNKIEVAGPLPDTFIIETKDVLVSGFPSNPALRVVGTSAPFNLEYFNGIESLMLSERAAFGIFDTIVPTEYPTPNAAIVAGKKRILVLPGSYDDTAFGAININTDNVYLVAINKNTTFWDFNQLIWSGSRGFLYGFDIGTVSGATVEIIGEYIKINNCSFTNTAFTFNEANNSSFLDIIITEIEDTDLFTIASSTGLLFDNLKIESFKVSLGQEFSLFKLEEGNEQLAVKKIEAQLPESDVQGNGYFAQFTSAFDSYLFDTLELTGFEGLFDIISGISSSTILSNLSILNLIGSANSFFFRYNSLSTATAPLRQLKLENIEMKITDETSAVFSVITPDNNSLAHEDWVFRNIQTNSSDTLIGTNYHYLVNTNTLNRWKMNGITSLGGYFLRFAGNGGFFNFVNIVIDGNASLAQATAKSTYLIDFETDNNQALQRIAISNISSNSRPNFLRLFARDGNINDFICSNFNVICTVDESGIGALNGIFYMIRSSASFTISQATVASGTVRAQNLSAAHSIFVGLGAAVGRGFIASVQYITDSSTALTNGEGWIDQDTGPFSFKGNNFRT